MWFGLVSEEQDALEVAGQTQNDVVIRFNSDWTDEVIWRWDGDGWAIESSTNTEASPPKENIMNLKHIDFKPTPNEGGLSAVIIESSDDAGASWEIHGIAWTVDRAVMLARNIPWDWRLRKVTLSDAGLIGWAEITSALGTMEKLESILATGNSSSIGEGKKYE